MANPGTSKGHSNTEGETSAALGMALRSKNRQSSNLATASNSKKGGAKKIPASDDTVPKSEPGKAWASGKPPGTVSMCGTMTVDKDGFWRPHYSERNGINLFDPNVHNPFNPKDEDIQFEPDTAEDKALREAYEKVKRKK